MLNSGLDWILGGRSTASLFNAASALVPLYLPTTGTDFSPLGALHSLGDALRLKGQYLSCNASIYREGRQTHPGRDVPTEIYERWLFDEYTRGGSIVIRRYEELNAAAQCLKNALAIELMSEISVHAYVSPASAQAFSAHFDPHNALILQLDGEKSWEVARNHYIKYPLQEDAQSQSVPSDELTGCDVITMQRGDVLFIPAGRVHRVRTSSEVSFHITVGVRELSWEGLAVALLKDARMRDERFRQPAKGEPPAWLVQLAGDLNATVNTELAVRRGFDRHRVDLVDSLTPPARAYLSSEVSTAIGPQTMLALVPGIYAATITYGDRVRLNFSGISTPGRPSYVEGPIALESTFKYMAENLGTFLVSEIPGGLTEEARVAIAQRLISEGLLVPASVISNQKT
ncbi:JmjC domain-containing protein [Rhizobium leguminosarum]|uniref:JmjC domain-containing protein n=1 Tax=Rhizobium leguminosarum TaxID=384 RepID=UPI001039DE15|nr:cupin domain-containing protein [Rhizobium leguminosarum]TBZ20993.1 hypothetical protein E0H33_00355 [Rhizobium leguminosarum bv. viciae]